MRQISVSCEDLTRLSDNLSTDRCPTSLFLMALWKPPGVNKTSPAKWESQPERTTFFLEILCEEKTRMIVGQQWPSNGTYNALIRQFWERYTTYHGREQFRNHYRTRKRIWTELRFAMNHTGLGWDPILKMVTASDDWWKWAQDHKRALYQFRNKTIPDYDLLERLFSEDRARGEYMRPPTSTTQATMEEGSGDSDDSSTERFNDPGDNVFETGQESTAPRSGERRGAGPCSRGRKKQKGSPMSRMERLVSTYFRPVNMNIDVCAGSASSNSSDPPLVRVAEVLKKEFSLEAGTPIFNKVTSIVARVPDYALIFLMIETRALKWEWIKVELQGSGIHVPTEPPPLAHPQLGGTCLT